MPQPPYTNRVVATRTVRRVWAVVTAEPQMRIRAMSARMGISSSTVSAALHVLRAKGYIDFPNGAAGARRIIVPFIVKEDDMKWTR